VSERELARAYRDLAPEDPADGLGHYLAREWGYRLAPSAKMATVGATIPDRHTGRSVPMLSYHATATEYAQFLGRKVSGPVPSGIDVAPHHLHPLLFPFQRDLTAWALQQGRAAIFADTGLGKTFMQVEWAHKVAEAAHGRVLILTPLAVSRQTVSEAAKLGIEVVRSSDGTGSGRLAVTNYERLHYFNPTDFVGIVCDESAILKNFDGIRRRAITQFMRHIPYRLLCSATPAPNDYLELGTSSEALGHLGHVDMLNRFFVNDQRNSARGRMYGKVAQWRFKGHAEEAFWRWVCSWARAIRKPSDFNGYDDAAFQLPPLEEREHVVTTAKAPVGMLFAIEALSLQEQRAERRRTIEERCQKVAELVDDGQPAVVWCHLNDEGDMLEKMIPEAVQVSGKDSDEAKEDRLVRFSEGDIRVLVTKPRIAGWGLNWQHCAHVTFFPSHSFEQYYQGVRRCWRYGQTRPVVVDIVTTEGEKRCLANLQAKAKAAEKMFEQLVSHMHEGLKVSRVDGFDKGEELPAWL